MDPTDTTLTRSAEVAPKTAADNNAKRRQILDGARAVFLAQGFDAASMGEIARAAGVSKGTLYVYFENKEELFEAIVRTECQAQAEHIFDFDPNDHDVGAVLTRLGIAYVKFLVRPEGLSSMRTFIAIADRMPEIGRRFYEAGPARRIPQLAAYLKAQVDAGVLEIDDCEVVAAQFLDASQATLYKPSLLNFGDPPTQERIEYVVGIAVRAFLAAYRKR